MQDAKPQTRVIVRQGPIAPPAPLPPGSEQELQALALKRGELAQQLEALTDRREEVADQLQGSEMAAQPGLVTRLRILDERIARLEEEVLKTDDAIAAAVSAGFVVPPMDQTGTLFEPPEPPRFSDDTIGIMVGEALAFILLGIVLYRLGWRRARAKFAGGAPQETGRMDQLQNAVDAIAVEVERISEGQRYVTKVLNEGSAPAAPLSVGQEEAIPVRRKAT